MVFNQLFFLIIALFAFNNAVSSSQNPISDHLIHTCITDSQIQEARSKELAQLLALDQKERENFNNHTSQNEINKSMINDLKRRKRVGEIMAEGCLKTAADYTSASLIYQHGDVPAHYYQAFIWANQAIALGDIKQKILVAMTIDRYLISTGKKQLFGTQYYAANAADGCFCLQPVEPSFPASLRMEYLGKKLADQYNFLLKLNKKMNCSVGECSTKLSSTPRGTIIGFW